MSESIGHAEYVLESSKPIEQESDAKPFLSYEEVVTSPEGEKASFQVEWDRVDNEYGEVETSTYHGAERIDKAVFYACGLGGSVDKFKGKYLRELVDQGYEVVLLHRNGTTLTQPSSAIDSSQRLDFAAKNGQDHTGSLAEYGYKEWCKEFSTAAHGLGKKYEEIKFVGASFGSLIGLEGLKQLREKNDPVLPKITSFVSLAGHIGMPETDEDGIVWIDKARKYSLKPAEGATSNFAGILEYLRAKKVTGGGIAAMEPTPKILDEYMEIMNGIYDPNTKLPLNVNYVIAMSWKEQFFATQQARKLMERVGEKSLFIADRTQQGLPGERHGMPQLTPQQLTKWLNIDPSAMRERVFTLSSQEEDIKPIKWFGANSEA